MEFSYSTQVKNSCHIFSIKGNLIEAKQASKMIEEVDMLLAAKPVRLVLDLSSFGHMNSTGLNVLLHIVNKTRTAGGNTVLCAVPKKTEELLAITKLNHIFTVTDTVENAISKLN